MPVKWARASATAHGRSVGRSNNLYKYFKRLKFFSKRLSDQPTKFGARTLARICCSCPETESWITWTQVDHKVGFTIRRIRLKKSFILSIKHPHLPPLKNQGSFNYQYKTFKKLTKTPYGQSDFIVNPVSTMNKYSIHRVIVVQTMNQCDLKL